MFDFFFFFLFYDQERYALHCMCLVCLVGSMFVCLLRMRLDA